jgi:hypothetical protein
MSRIELNMNISDMLVSLAEGNPGALSAMVKLIEENITIDPDSALGPVGAILSLDTNEIYGPDIWILFKDIAGQKPLYVIALLRAVQLGIISGNILKAAIKSENRGDTRLDVSDILSRVQQKLPSFGKAFKP